MGPNWEISYLWRIELRKSLSMRHWNRVLVYLNSVLAMIVLNLFYIVFLFQQDTPEPENPTRKSLSAKPRGRKPTNSTTKSQNSQQTPSSQSPPANSSPSQFALTSYSTPHTLAMAPPFHSTAPPQISQVTSQKPHHHHASYHMLPPQQTSAYVPLIYWPPPPNAFPYGHQSFPSAASYIPFHAQSYYNHPTCSSSVGKLLESCGKNDYVSDQSDSDSGDTKS